MVKRFDGDKGKLLVASLMLSVVKGQEFKNSPVSAISVASDSHQVIFHVFASEKTGWNELNGSDVPKHHPYGWHKKDSFSK